jgi:hypothetical protein
VKSAYEHKLDQLISRRFKAKLMNNTKWREVFTCLAKSELRFQVAWINAPDFPHDVLHSINLSWVGERGLLDPGIGGPCYYKEIAYIRIPTVLRLPKVMRGEVYSYQEKKQNVESLVAELHSLGQLPLTVMSDYVEIRGYI